MHKIGVCAIAAAMLAIGLGVWTASTSTALIVIVLVSLTFAVLEVFASGDQSLSAIEAAPLFTDQTE